MHGLVLALGVTTFFSTLLGGIVFLKFKNSPHYFFAFASGSIVAVAFLDLLPEGLKIADEHLISMRAVFLTIIASYSFYNLLQRFFLTHHIHDDANCIHPLGTIGASSLVIHSFFDGAAIGVAFSANFHLGVIVALAVITHDMTDGLNTVVIMIKNGHSERKAWMFLVLDALAPLVGIIVTFLIQLPQTSLVYLIAIFVGEFIYLGASNLPEAREYQSKATTVAMLLGVLMVVILTAFI